MAAARETELLSLLFAMSEYRGGTGYDSEISESRYRTGNADSKVWIKSDRNTRMFVLE